MNSRLPHEGSQSEPVYVLTDAAGRQFVSSAPPPQTTTAPAQPSPSPACSCTHHDQARGGPDQHSAAKKTGVYVAAAVGAGAVLVALLLSVAVVAGSLAVMAVAVTGCLLLLRSLSSPRR